MRSPSARYFDNEVFALTTLITFILHMVKQLTLADFAQPEPSDAQTEEPKSENPQADAEPATDAERSRKRKSSAAGNTNLTVNSKLKVQCTLDDLNRVTRRNGSMHLELAKITALRAAVNTAVATYEIQFPAFLDSVVHAASLAPPADTGMPRFLNSIGLVESGNDTKSLARTISLFQGCWRFFRVATAATKEAPLINRSLLYIKPHELLQAENKSLSEFTLYQRNDNDDEAGLNPGTRRTLGALALAGDDIVTLVGQREVADHRRVGNVALLTWPHYVNASHSQKPKSFFGLALIPNSQGRQIASYFLASYIKDSASFDDKEFVDCLAQESPFLRSAGLDVQEANVSKEEMAEIGKLLAVSEQHLVFHKII